MFPEQMNRLDEIIAVKRREIEQVRPRAAELYRQALVQNDFRDFHLVVKRTDRKLAVIAEIKKASPSAGVISKWFDPVAIAKNYERGGANAISVLTDSKFFQGALGHLVDIRAAIALPVLRKDFILDEVQIAESAAAGADAILLIVAALEQKQLVDLSTAAEKYRLAALVEVHSAEELSRALDTGAKIIGINNRDLATFEVDLSVTEELSEQVPDDVVVVSESGIKSLEDIAYLQACGVDAVLIGEALMRRELSIRDLQ